MAMTAINPATGEELKAYPETSEREVENIVRESDAFFKSWRRRTFSERAELMKKAASILNERKDEYAKLMAVEMGKPVVDGRAEAQKCAWVCEFFAEHASRLLEPENVETEARRSFVTFQPIGIVLAVMPWNFPFWQVFRFAAPALMAGNTVLLKHASNVPGCSLAIEDVFRKSGFPKGAFRSLLISSDQVGKAIENPLVRGVTLTGSRSAGRTVAKKAGSVLKKTVLELGGSDPYIVLEDADLEEAVKACVAGRLLNSGQSCIAAKRFIVVEPVRKEFEEMLVEEMKKKIVGDPLLEDVQIGPQAKDKLREKLHKQATDSIQKGAKLLLGGKMPASSGFFYPLTVLTNVAPGMPAFDEETFGPVAAVVPAKDEADAIALANNSVYGLGAAIFSRNIDRAVEIATNEIETGNCFVNDFVKSDPRLPFGGIKDSGYGRELSAYGIKEFVNVKTIRVK